MRRESILVRVIAIVILGLGVIPVRLLAAGPQTIEDLPLVPLGAPGFVQLTSFTLTAEYLCSGSQCTLRIQQSYQLYNRDRVEEAALRIGLNKPQEGAVPTPSVTLQDKRGAVLPAAGSDAEHSVIWETKLGRNENKILLLSYAYPVPAGHLLHWRWEMPLLGMWGTVDGARVEFSQPEYMTDDALLVAEPKGFSFDGKRFLWEYESLQSPLRHELVMISPGTWQQISKLRAAGAHYELARLYEDIQATAQGEHVSFPDPFNEVVAELRAALEDQPGSASVHLDLAQIYRTRADTASDLRLNYLLLSAQELFLALQQRPGDTQIVDALRRAYSDAAASASEAGDPTSALDYLKMAEGLPGTPNEQERKQQEILSMRWALKIAEQGLTSRSWEQIESALSPQVRDTLLLHAPPAVSVRTEVELRPQSRSVRYRFELDPPSASQTVARLQELAGRLRGLGTCQVALEADSDPITLSIQVAYRSAADLQQQAATMLQAIAPEQDLLSAFVAAPWQMEGLTYTVERGSWRDRYLYQESVDLTPLQDAWEKEAEYTRWRVAELSIATPADERDQLEQRLGLLVLREQGRTWQHLPVGSYWVFHTIFATPQTPSNLTWLVSWGQARALRATLPILHSSPIMLLFPLALGILVLWGILAAYRRRR